MYYATNDIIIMNNDNMMMMIIMYKKIGIDTHYSITMCNKLMNSMYSSGIITSI